MALPAIPMPTQTVQVGGQDVQITGLSRAQFHQLRNAMGGNADNIGGAEAELVACATGCSVEEANAWLGSVPSDAAGVLIDAITELSGLGGSGNASS